MLTLGNIKRRKRKNMERKYNIIICPEYDVPLDKLKESGVEFCKKELSDFGTIGVPLYLFDVDMIMRSIPVDITTWLWHKERNGMSAVEWVKKARKGDYVAKSLEKHFGPLCEIAKENIKFVHELFGDIYINIKEEGEEEFIKVLNKVNEAAVEDMGSLIRCFVEHGYISQQDYLERKYPMAFRVVNDPQLGKTRLADLIFFYKEGEYEEGRANMDVRMFCELNEVSARMLFCHKQDEDDDLPHGQLS